MPRFVFHVAYTGTRFHGWQRQKQEPTVQGAIEKALSTVCNKDIAVHAAGRTDAGVHALDQVIHCDLPENKKDMDWTRALNSLLPGEVCITSFQVVSPEFHARKNAVYKQYSYTFWTEPKFVLPQRRPFVWPAGNLDVSDMRRACQELQGKHDFVSLMNVGTQVRTTVRNMYKLEIRSISGNELELTARADGFLKQMVRNVAGLLYAVGKHKLGPSDIPRIIAEKNRSVAPATAPAKGLCLERVFYSSQI